MSVSVDIYQTSERNLNCNVPRIYSIVPETIIENTHGDALYYSINLIGFDNIWQSYILTLESNSCKNSNNNAVVTFKVPWLNGDQHFFFE